uniref:Transmembrane protein 245 n=2 Tax=Clastoptera arizonana TaxID=38151 RepID=A0A1B6D8U2_9HEMI
MFMFFQLLYILGIIYNWWNSKKIEQHIVSNVTSNYTEDINNQKLLNLSSEACKDEKESKELKRNANMANTFLVEWPLNHLWQFASDNTSDIYIYWVAMACVTTIVLKSSWLLYIIVLLLSLYATRHLSAYFGVTVFFHKQYNTVLGYFKNWLISRKEAIFISPIKGIVTVCYVIKMQILELLKGSSDSAATVMVILGLLIFLIFSTTFLGIQACTEGVYMIKVGGNVINQTVVHNPGLKQLLPDNWEHKFDLALNNAYMYGREWLSTMVHNMLVGVHEEKAIELEKRALDLWDRVYQAWIMNALEEKTIGPKVTSKAVYQTWYHFLDGFQKTPELMNMKTLSQLLQNNTETLKGGLESLWDIAKGNASILLHAISTMLSVLFNHGFAVFNFFISMVIFLTALFYLLNSSRQLYKPVEMACTKSPVYGERLGLAFEKAINEVLIASFKLAIFYGMWTWLIHNIFQMNIVYIPTVLATILAVVPVLGTYWACLPGVIDLWLVQGKNIHAIVLACFQFLPTTIVDATIYNEINSGHPYLTGLSVAGGLFCLGIEGAIIGPLVLCGLHVVINLSTVFLQDSKTTQ